MNKELLFNFSFHAIKKHTEELDSMEKKLEYLYEVQHIIELIEVDKDSNLNVSGLKWETDNEYIDYYLTTFSQNNIQLTSSNFSDQSYSGLQEICYLLSRKIKSLIEYYVGLKNIQVNVDNNFQKVFTTIDRQSLIRIIFSMIESGIISPKNTIKQIGDKFDSEVDKFVNNYFRVSKEITDEERKTHKQALKNFVVTLIRQHFTIDDTDNIIREIEKSL